MGEPAAKVTVGPGVLTRFERARVIGNRALQLSLGAPPLVQVNAATVLAPMLLAEKELNSRVLPIAIRRKLPDRRYADIPVNWLLA